MVSGRAAFGRLTITASLRSSASESDQVIPGRDGAGRPSCTEAAWPAASDNSNAIITGDYSDHRAAGGQKRPVILSAPDSHGAKDLRSFGRHATPPSG